MSTSATLAEPLQPPPLGKASIIDFVSALPSGVRSAQDLAAHSGLDVEHVRRITHCETIPVLAEGESVLSLCVRAAGRLRDRHPGRFAEIDRVVVAGAGHWDHPFWSPSAALAHELGIRTAHCFEVANFCNSSATGLRLALDAVGAGTSRLTLLVLADQLSRVVDTHDPAARELFNYGDAATALLVGSDRGRFDILDSLSLTDPSWSGFYRGEHGPSGSVLLRNNEVREGLGERYVEAFDQLVAGIFGRNGIGAADVGMLLINHGDRRMHEALLSRLGIPPERSWFRYDAMGHMGSSDPFLALDEASDAGRIRAGDAVLIASSGLGFTWGVTLLKAAACES